VSAQPGLFLGAAGAALSADFIAADVEQDRIAHIRALPLAPFQFGAFEGKRRVASFGWRYDYGQHKLEQAEEIPAWLAPLSAKVESFAALPDSAVRQVLFTEYEAGAAGIAKAALRARLRTVGASACKFRFAARRAGGSGSPSQRSRARST
jgi:hypothetical protein